MYLWTPLTSPQTGQAIWGLCCFGNQDLLRSCANQIGITNLMGLHLVYDLNSDSLEVVSGYGSNQTLLCSPLTFSGGVFLSNTNATKSERQALGFYPDGNPTPVGTLTATESYGYGVSNDNSPGSACLDNCNLRCPGAVRTRRRSIRAASWPDQDLSLRLNQGANSCFHWYMDSGGRH